MEEREQERKRLADGRGKEIDPELVRRAESLRLARIELDRQRAATGNAARKQQLTHALEEVRAANGLLHVSLDVDFMDPELAPGVGTTVPGGATFREAHLIMEMLWESGLVSSLDVVELNPFLDDRGKSARILVELTASLFGRRVLDRPTRSA